MTSPAIAPSMSEGPRPSSQPTEAISDHRMRHDLRHEAGSRFIEAGWPIHHVQEMLGHKDLSQTNTYLNATQIGLQESMRKFDDLASRCKIVARQPEIGRTPPCNEEVGQSAQPLIN